MRGHVISSSNFGDTTVGGHDHDWCLITLKSSVKEREAFDVEHMDLIDEEDTWDDLSTAFFSPLGDLLVDLLANFRLDFTDITREKSHEALGSGIDDIDLMECDGVHDFLSLLKFTFWALNESGLWSNIIVVTASGE